MEFKGRVFIPKKISYWKRRTLSEKVFDFSVLFILIFYSFYYIFLRNENEEFITNKFLAFTMFSPFIGILISKTIRFKEFEIAKGDLLHSISFEKEGIQILEKMFLFSEIQNLHISYGDVVGNSTDNINYGPMISIGINNYIEFMFENKKVTTCFQIQSRSQYVAIQGDLYYYVINEIFPFEKKNLSFIDKKYHNHTLYKEFIEKMKREGKLS